MAVSILGKKVKISKNRKPYWRKHVNLKDVEEFLDEKREDERFGGPVADKLDDDLFVVEGKRHGKSSLAVKEGLPVLRCFQNLQPDSAVAPPVKPPQLQGGAVTKARAQPTWTKTERRKKVRGHPRGQRVGRPGKKRTRYDLWSEDAKSDTNDKNAVGVDSAYLPEKLTRTTVKVPEYRYQKPSLLAAVETPHPGASYNPTYQDHQDLLMSAHLVEVKKQKEEDYLDRNLTSKFPKVLPTQEAWLEEMSAGLFDTEAQEPNKDEQEEKRLVPGHQKTWGQPVSFLNKKTRAERNQERANSIQLKKMSVEKLKKRRVNDLNSLKSIKKQIVKAEALSEARLKKRERHTVESMYQARRLGPCKYVAPELEIQLGEDLPDNLRTLKVEGNLLQDRLKSLQRRNLIEPRQRRKAPKKKVKVLLRRTHKD